MNSAAAQAGMQNRSREYVGLKNPYFIGDNSALTQTCGWVDACQPSVYAVAARTTEHVVAAAGLVQRLLGGRHRLGAVAPPVAPGRRREGHLRPVLGGLVVLGPQGIRETSDLSFAAAATRILAHRLRLTR